MFLGRFEHSVDNKGRVAVPARFRGELEGELIITRGNDRCLYLFTQQAWEPLASKLNALPTGDADARNLRRAVFSAAEPVEIESRAAISRSPSPVRGDHGQCGYYRPRQLCRNLGPAVLDRTGR